MLPANALLPVHLRGFARVRGRSREIARRIGSCSRRGEFAAAAGSISPGRISSGKAGFHWISRRRRARRISVPRASPRAYPRSGNSRTGENPRYSAYVSLDSRATGLFSFANDHAHHRWTLARVAGGEERREVYVCFNTANSFIQDASTRRYIGVHRSSSLPSFDAAIPSFGG